MIGGQKLGQIMQGGSLQRAQHQLAAGMIHVADHSERLIGEREDHQRIIIKNLPFGCQGNAALVSVKQRLAQFFFQLLDAIREIGLRVMQILCRG